MSNNGRISGYKTVKITKIDDCVDQFDRKVVAKTLAVIIPDDMTPIGEVMFTVVPSGRAYIEFSYETSKGKVEQAKVLFVPVHKKTELKDLQKTVKNIFAIFYPHKRPYMRKDFVPYSL